MTKPPSSPQSDEDRLFEAHAAICRVLANPWRLRIVEALGRGETTVSQLAESLGISMSNLSQHLALMKDKGVVRARKSGGYVHYSLTSPKTLAAWRLMREVLLERLAEAGELSRAAAERPPTARGRSPAKRGLERKKGTT